MNLSMSEHLQQLLFSERENNPSRRLVSLADRIGASPRASDANEQVAVPSPRAEIWVRHRQSREFE